MHHDRWGNFVTQTDGVAREAQIPFERRTVAEFEQHLPHVKVTAVLPTTSGVDVVAAGNTYSADRAIIATGPWFEQLAPPVDAARVEVTRQVVYWFETSDPDAYSAEHFRSSFGLVIGRRTTSA